MDPVFLLLAILSAGFCAFRVAMCAFVYNDASAKGRDAMAWLGLVSVLGIIGLVIWLASRPRPVRPVWIPYGHYPPPGWYPPQAYQPSAPYPPPAAQPVEKGQAREVFYAYPRVRTPAGGPGVPPAVRPAGGQPTPPPASWQLAPTPVVVPSAVPPDHPTVPQPPPLQPPRAPGYKPFSVRRMLATLVAAMALTACIEVPIIFLVMAQVPDWTADPEALLAQLLSPGLLLVLIAIQDALLVGLTWLSMFRPRHLSLRDIGATLEANLPRGALLGLLAGLALFAVANGIGWLLQRTGWFGDAEGIIQVGTPAGLVLTLIATVAIAPVAEEFFFRAYALPVLERRWGPTAGIALSALMFALVHGNLYQLVPIFFAGIILAVLFRKWGIMPCIAAHAVNNALAVVLMYLGFG